MGAKRLKILVVEDNEATRRLIELSLEGRDYEVIDKLSDEDWEKMVQLAARRLAGEGIAATTMSDVWIGACYDIMRDMIENDISLDEVAA